MSRPSARPPASTSGQLFAADPGQRPLAERMRPRCLDEVLGQQRLLGEQGVLRRAFASGRPHSMVLWGPPGCGKTTLARMLADYASLPFVSLSAVLAGLPDVRRVLDAAAKRFPHEGPTLLFIDEVHRFNKLQQDAFLPGIEAGEIVFVGATTENPSFELNSALLSRCRVHVLDALQAADLLTALERALGDSERGLAASGIGADRSVLAAIAEAADGDVRRALTLLEIAVDGAVGRGEQRLQLDSIAPVLADRRRRFDKGGEQFYDQISALHKSVRSSNPDAALYWLVRMLDGGCDPHYLARRLVRMAVEDIGLADPRALQMANDAWAAFDRLGSPEGELALAQLVLYLASTAKSNAGYAAFKAAKALIEQTGTAAVPMHLRNAPTGLMKSLGYGQGYQYDHERESGIAWEQTGFPDEIGERLLYSPVDRGLESKLKAKLDDLRQRRAAARAEIADGDKGTG